MRCPNCSANFSRVKLFSHYDAPLYVEQCSQCGGIWFDEDEAWRVRHGEGKRVESIDSGKLAEKVPIHKSMDCPKHHSKLVRYADASFPDEIKIEQCPLCSGLWFNRGAFTVFQDFREARKKERMKPDKKMDEQLAKKIETLLASQSDIGTFEKLGAWGKKMSKPVTSSRDVSEFFGTQQNSKATDIVAVLLRLLMAILLKR